MPGPKNRQKFLEIRTRMLFVISVKTTQMNAFANVECEQVSGGVPSHAV